MNTALDDYTGPAKERLTVSLGRRLCARLDIEARRRKMPPAALARLLLRIIIQDNLFAAIIDDE